MVRPVGPLPRRALPTDATRTGLVIIWVLIAFILGLREGQALLCLPVAVYGLYLLVSPGPQKYTGHPGRFVFGWVAAIRYLLLPTLMILSVGSSGHAPVTDRAILLMVYEEVVVLIALRQLTERRPALRQDLVSRHEPRRTAGLWGVVVLAALCTVAYPSVLNTYHTVFRASSALVTADGGHISGLILLIVGWGRTLLPLLLIMWLREHWGESRPGVSYALSIATVLVVNVGVFTGVSRQSALVPGLASLFFLLALFPRQKRKTWAIMLLGLFVSFAMMSALKAEYITARSGSSRTVSAIESAEAYFNGYSSLDVALKMRDVYGHRFTAETYINDLLGSFPGLRLDLGNRTTVFYNYVYYGGGPAQDQILPFTGQALFHFGFVLLWIPIAAAVALMSAFDRLFRLASSPLEKYLYAYAAVILGMSFMLNASVIMAYMYTVVVPGMALILILRRRDRAEDPASPATFSGESVA